MEIGRSFCFSVAVCALFPAASLCGSVTYQIVDLGTLGGSTSKAMGISGSGRVAGDAKDVSSVQHAVIWDASGITDLGAPGGFTVTSAVAVNDSGQAAATGEGNPQSYGAYLWDDGTWIPLGAFAGQSDSIAADVNSGGQVAGTSFSVGGGGHRGFLWEAGILTDLGTLGGATRAEGINDAGQITGYSYAPLPAGGTVPRAYVWADGTLTELGLLAGETHARAFDINELSEVVGGCYHITSPQLLAQNRATLWPAASAEVVDLGPTPGPEPCILGHPYYTDNIARAANNCGQIVGHAECVGSGGPLAAFLWQDGVMSNLNDLIPAGSGWSLLSALDINDAGQIVGIGLDPGGNLHGFMLDPSLPTACGVRALEIGTDGLRWKPEAGAAGYDIVLGDLGVLFFSAGDFMLATSSCLANDHPNTELGYTGSPAPGEGSWILIRAVIPTGTGSYDDGTLQVGSRDPGINASPSSCP